MKTNNAKSVAPANPPAAAGNNNPKAALMTADQMNRHFASSAVVVSDFQATLTPSFIRMACSELDASGAAHLRAVLAFDYNSLHNLKKVIDAICMHVKPPEQAASHEEKAPDDTKAKVGVDIQA